MKRIIMALLLLMCLILAGCEPAIVTTTINKIETSTITVTTEKTKTDTVLSTVLSTIPASTVSSVKTVTSFSLITITTTPPQPNPVYTITKPLTYKITEKSNNFWYFSWQISIKNVSFSDIRIYIKIDFVDSDGYSLDWTNEIVTITAGQDKTILGESMINTAKAGNVTRAVADISIY